MQAQAKKYQAQRHGAKHRTTRAWAASLLYQCLYCVLSTYASHHCVLSTYASHHSVVSCPPRSTSSVTPY